MQALLLLISLSGAADSGLATILDPGTLATPAPTLVSLNTLKELFHGKPAPQKKALPPKQKAVITWDVGVVRETKVDAILEAYAAALMARDAAGLEPLVASNYTIENLPANMKPITVLRQAIEQAAGPTLIEVKSVETSLAGTIASAEFRYEKLDAKTRTIKLDGNGKLLWSDFFAIKLQTHEEVSRG